MDKIRTIVYPLLVTSYITIMIGTVAWMANQLFVLTGATATLVERVDGLGKSQDQLIVENREHVSKPHTEVDGMIQLAIMGLRLEIQEEIQDIRDIIGGK